jgi:hypothetical protein
MTFISPTSKDNSCEAGPVNRVCREPVNFEKSADEVRFQMDKNNNRRILMGRRNIRALRISYVMCTEKYRSEWRPIVFMNETYIHGSLSAIENPELFSASRVLGKNGRCFSLE